MSGVRMPLFLKDLRNSIHIYQYYMSLTSFQTENTQILSQKMHFTVTKGVFIGATHLLIGDSSPRLAYPLPTRYPR